MPYIPYIPYMAEKDSHPEMGTVVSMEVETVPFLFFFKKIVSKTALVRTRNGSIIRVRLV